MTKTSSAYGTLTDYVTGEQIRPAARDEWLTSIQAGETGAFRDDDGRDLFVAGGPESEADEPTYQIPAEPTDLKQVSDFGGDIWTREPGRGGQWFPPEDLDVEPMRWGPLLLERGPLTAQ